MLGSETAHRGSELLDRRPGPAQSLSTLQLFDRLAAGVADQTRLIREQAAYIARYRKMYDRASAMAKIGVWECDLATGALTWTDGVYDIFELPRGSHVTREQILALYDDASRVAMTALRQKAIEACGTFQLDIRVHTARGRTRWVRLTADIECDDDRPVRIFGSKQDITQEKEAAELMRRLAESDHLTGLGNRGLFQTELNARLLAAQPRHRIAALVLIDLDGFKDINDTFGHAAGDECLKHVAARLRAACDTTEIVARIGGDEFALLLTGSRDRRQVEARIADMLVKMQPPIAWRAAALTIGASIGIAIPRGTCASTLFGEADAALYAAKNAGGSGFRTYEPTLTSGRRPRRQASDTALPGS